MDPRRSMSAVRRRARALAKGSHADVSMSELGLRDLLVARRALNPRTPRSDAQAELFELGTAAPCQCDDCCPVWQTVDDAATWVERMLRMMDEAAG